LFVGFLRRKTKYNYFELFPNNGAGQTKHWMLMQLRSACVLVSEAVKKHRLIPETKLYEKNIGVEYVQNVKTEAAKKH